MRRFILLGLLAVSQPGCLYRAGQNLTAGMLDEAIGQDRQGGADELARKIIEKQLALEIGHQLGSGLASGATDITPEQQAALEAAIDGLLAVTAERTGEGLRKEVSPALRQMVRDDIVRALAEGMRNEVGPAGEEVADRVVTQAIVALRRGLQDAETQVALSEMIRESFYLAMREGTPYAPGVGETLQATLDKNVLRPVEGSVDAMSTGVAAKVAEQARRTERILQAVIAAAVLIAAVFLLMYVISRRQLLRERAQQDHLRSDLRTLEVGLGLLDEATRDKLMGSLDVHRGGGRGLFGEADARKPAEPKKAGRSDEYERKK